MTEKLETSNSVPVPSNDTDFDRLAAEELIRDAQRNASRADSFGSTAWKKGPLPRPNMNFMARAVSGTVIQNARMQRLQRDPERRAQYEARHQAAQCDFRSEGLQKSDSRRLDSDTGRSGRRREDGRREQSKGSPQDDSGKKRISGRDSGSNRRSRSPRDRKWKEESGKSVRDGVRDDKATE